MWYNFCVTKERGEVVDRKGFTLTELIVVIVIIGILAAIAVPAMTANVARARRAEAISTLGALRTAQKLYFSETGAYAPNITPLSAYIPQTELTGRYYLNTAYSTTATNITATDAGTGGGSVNMVISNGFIDNP